jgi:NAD(P)-dependent dehydrogenase (short-subunit alcohol dehydrogenase family)
MRVWIGALLVGLLAVGMLNPHMSFKSFPTPAPGSHILVTGASSGIGKHAALRLASEGFTVLAGVRKAADGEALLLENPKLIPVIIDVADEKSVEASLLHITAILARAAPANAHLAGLVNNAGVSTFLPLELQSIEDMRGVFDVNVFGLVSVTKTFLPLLRHSKGRIINIGSVAGLFSTPGLGTYSATKFAVRALSDSLRRELSIFEMSVSLVEPAFVKTEIAAKGAGASAPHHRLSASDFELYAHVLKGWDQERMKAEEKADSPEVTSDAIYHALSSPRPQTRYVVANVNGIPAPVISFFLHVLPDRVLDALLILGTDFSE